MEDVAWLAFCVKHELIPESRLPAVPPRVAGDRNFRSAICCVCNWVGTSTLAHIHRDITGHPVVWPTPER